ncbi:MAG: tRNA (N6-threonylcarbamoyladenosine(37)-N6)-methyltransferase TrmO [Methanobacteriota archaeon]|nr:MAG: tRNA (N6-threonylcarbamoyladenosine(37)-N6)-methyltransferase TrmO [Euryarchaeota archaeon]
MMRVNLKPIATVRNGVTDDVDDWDKVTSRLIFEREWVDGLYKLGRFDHVLVIFGFHRKRGVKLRVHPRHDPSKPLVGVFASRSPRRPNKLGLTRVELLSVRGNVVTVQGLDAYDGSPVFDVKPPLDEIDY